MVLVTMFGLCDGLVLQPDATDRLRDDAFYEFAWAANVAAGRGPMVSDGVTTSGVQLLWSLLLVPVAWSLGAASLPVVAPWLGFSLHLLTAWCWWRFTPSRATGALLALLWLGNPLLVRECQNGQETALACLFASLLWLWRRRPEPTWIALGVLAVMARSDLLALVIAMAVWRCLRLRRPWWTAAAAPALALVVHVGANLLLGGGWMPDSALPMAWLWHHNHTLADPTGATFWAQQWWYTRPVLLGGPFAQAHAMGIGLVVFLLLRPWWPAALRVLPALLVGTASALGVRDLSTAGWVALLLALLPAVRRRRLPIGALLVLLGLGAIVALHWAVRWYPRDYYVAPLVVVAMVGWQRLGRWRVVLLAAALWQAFDRGRVRPEPLAGQAEMELAGRHLQHLLPAGERVGCFNSGLVTFHADVLAPAPANRAVVNLDGVVDARAFAALRGAALADWLDRERIRFVLDNPVQFATDPVLPHACGHWFGAQFEPARDLVEVARFDVPGLGNGRAGGDSFRLYWRRDRGSCPPLPTAAQVLSLAADHAVVLWPARKGQQLLCERSDGTSSPLVTVDVDTAVVLPVARANGPVRLCVAGAADPVLILPPL